MRTFTSEKVKEIAIDLPNRGQIYVVDQENKLLILDTLKDMGFKGDWIEIIKQPIHYPVVVDTYMKAYFVIPTGLMACAVQSGAKAINYQEMLLLICD